MASGHQLGQWGEDVARLFLEMCGYRCLSQGFRRPGGELDLVVDRNGLLVFVEVKTRGPRTMEPPETWLTRRQLHLLRRMAGIWLAEHPGVRHRGFRFDVVAIVHGGDVRGSEIRHLTGVG